jgi:Tol biopolymer transport system component
MRISRLSVALLLVILWLLAGCVAGAVTSPTPSPAVPVPTALPAVPQPSQADPTSAALVPDSYQLTWAGRGLSGRLLLIHNPEDEHGNTLMQLDLQTGKIGVLFQAPPGSRLLSAALSPDGARLALAYAAPQEGVIQLGDTDLYLLPAGSQADPQLLIARTAADESYFAPTWSPNGQTLLYSHFYPVQVNNVPAYKYAIEQVQPGGKPQVLIQDGYWPVLSPDGAKILFIYVDPASFGNDLYVADADGNHKTALTFSESMPPVDAHLFSQDGKTVYFSMVNAQPQPVRSPLERFFGIQSASAHSVPSDWYRKPVGGGKVERVTNLSETNMWGAISPDGRRLAFVSSSGLYAVNLDGSDLVQLSDSNFEGSIQWLP